FKALRLLPQARPHLCQVPSPPQREPTTENQEFQSSVLEDDCVLEGNYTNLLPHVP
ncbi:hypothetical protein LEMLEM_LOCUS6955, partial [Lemmus lemmus]